MKKRGTETLPDSRKAAGAALLGGLDGWAVHCYRMGGPGAESCPAG
jgi:hypothetical protein